MTPAKEPKTASNPGQKVDENKLLGPDFARAFNPKSVAVVGASRASSGDAGSWRNPSGQFIPYLQHLGYRGKIFPVNPKATEILGLRAYPNLTSLPEAPDMVTVSVPARFLVGVLDECASIGALNVHVFTSGFSETATPEGIELEKVVLEAAERGRLRLVGPNCLGIHSPRHRFSTIGDVKSKPGGAAFVAQSGGHSMDFIFRASDTGLGVSKVISFGNALVLDSPDYLEYLAEDEDTKTIGMYLEGVKDGKRLLRLVKEINTVKPVIIWKGGLTASGSRAAASHTASLTGQRQVWDAFFKQTGAVEAGSVEEIVGVMRAFTHLPKTRGNRVVLIGSGGGNSVAAADICSGEGLDMTVLSQETSERLREFIPDAGNSVRNPLDLSFMSNVRERQKQAAEVVTRDPAVDLVMMIPSLAEYTDSGGNPERAVAEEFAGIARDGTNGKPVVAVLPGQIRDPKIRIDHQRLQREFDKVGVLAYTSLRRACSSLARFVAYHRRQESLGGD